LSDCGVGISAVGADQSINHQLQRTGRLVLVDRRDQDDPVGGESIADK
jgi:hypothetical protein